MKRLCQFRRASLLTGLRRRRREWRTSKTKPDVERVLRCASVIADKRKKFAQYRQKGIVWENDCTVIAVNICQLSDHDMDGNGISRYPLTMEALFPIGPLAVPIGLDGSLGEAENTARFTLRKATGNEIPGAYFLETEFANVSAVVQAYQRDTHGKDLILATVHNPLALNPLPTGLFGARKEFVAEADDDVTSCAMLAVRRGSAN